MSEGQSPPEWPSHLRPYARSCPADLDSALRAARPAAEALRLVALACRCGESQLIAGVSYNWEVVDAACASCGHEFPIYDPKHHGYAGAGGANDYERPPFESVPFGCMCRMMQFELAVALDYGAARLGVDDFTFIVVAGRCATCGMTNLILDADCA